MGESSGKYYLRSFVRKILILLLSIISAHFQDWTWSSGWGNLFIYYVPSKVPSNEGINKFFHAYFIINNNINIYAYVWENNTFIRKIIPSFIICVVHSARNSPLRARCFVFILMWWPLHRQILIVSALSHAASLPRLPRFPRCDRLPIRRKGQIRHPRTGWRG